MHFEILVEDRSGKDALEIIIQKIIGKDGEPHTYKIHSYKGIGHLPQNLNAKADPQKRVLLNRLPSLLQGYGNAFQNYPAVVVVVVDLDNRDCIKFKQELISVLQNCNPQPTTLFRIAIEEGEAWLLGDRNAIRTAYPEAGNAILKNYVQDSICGTWEVLADAVHPGGAQQLKKVGYPEIGITKCKWAKEISPHMDIENNASKSFQVFRDGIRSLTTQNS